MWLVLTTLACTTRSPVDVRAEDAGEVADPGPGIDAELAVPEHPDLVLGSLSPPSRPEAFLPSPERGAWQAYRVWSSRDGAEWVPQDVLVTWVAAERPQVEVHRLRASGERMGVSSADRFARTGPIYGVVASRQPDGSFRALGRTEILWASEDTVFVSPWTREKVAVDVQGERRVTVPAGTFDALQVERSWASPERAVSDHLWWTAEHGVVARVWRVETAGRVDVRLTVLAEHGVVPDPQVLRQPWADARLAMGLPE